MGPEIKRNKNRTTFVRCPKDEDHPFHRIPAKLCELDGYQLAIMVQIIANKDGWNIVKSEIARRLVFPRQKFNDAWKELLKSGHIIRTRIQGGYDYTIFEDLGFTGSTGGNCENSTSTTGGRCTGGMLTTINNNYYNREVTSTADSNCENSQFDELLAAYPSQGTRSDGSTYSLKGKRKECKKIYNEYLKTNTMSHDEILVALKVELNNRKRNGGTLFQQSLFRWIEDRTFEEYKGRTIEPVKVGYGESFL